MSRTRFTYAESSRARTRADTDGGRTLSSVERAFEAIDLLSAGRMRSSQLSQLLGTSRSGAYSLLRALEGLSVVRQDPVTKEFSLDWKLFEIGQRIVTVHPMLRLATAKLDGLAAATGESALLAVRDKSHALYVGFAESRQSVRLTAGTGRRTSLHASASGKALLMGMPPDEVDALLAGSLTAHTDKTIVDMHLLKQELSESRARGYAVCLGEWERSEASVSVPLVADDGSTVAALTVGGPTDRFTATNIRRFAVVLADTAREILLEMGHSVMSGTAREHNTWRRNR